MREKTTIPVIRSIVTILCFIFICSWSPAWAGSTAPDYSPRAPIHKTQPQVKDQSQIYYGYVPPPPIRHTWPGGYRAIFMEMSNTLIDHILGRY